ncbi:MAG: hypothetical protein GX359_02925 [Clostridiales bacterium]|nr:hypothetical protein [Clostridiales bacterium]
MIINNDMNVLLEEGEKNNVIVKRKRYFIITTFIIIAIVAVILCVSFFAQPKTNEYDGTLVEQAEIITNMA